MGGVTQRRPCRAALARIHEWPIVGPSACRARWCDESLRLRQNRFAGTCLGFDGFVVASQAVHPSERAVAEDCAHPHAAGRRESC